jgi:hypothetical protein
MRVTVRQLQTLIEGILREYYVRDPSHEEVLGVMRRTAVSVIRSAPWHVVGDWPDMQVAVDERALESVVEYELDRYAARYRQGASEALNMDRLAGEFAGMIKSLPDMPAPWIDIIYETMKDDYTIPDDMRHDIAKQVANAMTTEVQVLRRTLAGASDSEWLAHTRSMADL